MVIGLLIFQLLLYALSIVSVCLLDVFSCEPSYIANIFMDLAGISISIGLYSFYLLTKKKSHADEIMMCFIVSETVILTSDLFCWLVQYKANLSFVNLVANFIFYQGSTIFPLIAWFFQVEVSHMKDRGVSANSKLVIAIYIIHFIILLVNLFTGFLYTVDFETGTYSRTGPFWISLLPGVLIFMISCYYLFSRNVSRKLRFGILVINLIPFVCGLIQVFTYGISIAYIGMLLAIALLYVSIQVNLKRDLEDARTSLMVSQINPHFVFNTLATIEALCESDPKLASKTINNFSKYLRCNMAVMDQNAPIPLLTEIEQVKMYASICMLRFDNIHIEYDLKDTDFYIPSLTVQPLVENAMRHGLRAKEDALVTVRSYQKDKFHIVEVEDNGIGFDLKAVKADSKLHIGLKNVEERLINMSSGKMIVQSQPGKGTLITMKIPLSKN